MVSELMTSSDTNSNLTSGRRFQLSASQIVFHAQELVILHVSRSTKLTEIACTFLEVKMMKITNFRILGNTILHPKSGL